MDADEESKNIEQYDVLEKSSAVNNLILDYYKKFGKKRDLEQFFSLSTAQNEIRDPSSLFWRRMKALSDSSESGDKKSESSSELCRIQIRCSIPEPSGSQVQEVISTEESKSPPIVNENPEVRETDDDSDNSDDVHSQTKDGTLDTSMNKPHSPTSSVTSQRKLEWDSLADVGYGNESDKKTSASSLSTLERLAIQQQYCINDTQQSSNLGIPTAHSTPVEPNESKSKGKKDYIKKTSKIFSRDVDHIQLTLPQIPETSQAFNLNLTKHITFNVDKKGEVSIENLTKNVSRSPEKVSVETEMTPEIKIDKEIQTTLNKGEKPCEVNISPPCNMQRFPVHVNLNTLKKRNRKKKLRKVRQRKPKDKKQGTMHKKVAVEHKIGGQISAAESFEYMPGHIYDQNQINIPQGRSDNKSSLESSAGHTTDSSKNSFATDLDKCINVLKVALNKRHTDNDFKNKIVKDIVQRLLKARYKDDESSTDFLSRLSFDSKKLGFAQSNHTTSSTSDPNHTLDNKQVKPKKSILRTDKFDSKMLPSASQSTPNIPSVVASEMPLPSLTAKICATSNTDTDVSGKDTMTSSEELYQKYLKALRREQTYKQHLKEKELLYKQKFVRSDLRLNALSQQDVKSSTRLNDLMKDLIRNNYDDGSGDASRLEGGSSSHLNMNMNPIRNHRSHSVFTLSSGTSDNQHKNTKLKNRPSVEIETNACSSKKEKHYCCCPYHTSHGKIGVTDSSVQVNLHCCESKLLSTQSNHTQASDKCALQSPNMPHCSNVNENIKCVCSCNEKVSQKNPEHLKILKCSCMNSKTLMAADNPPHQSNYTCGNLLTCINSGSFCKPSSPRNIKPNCENRCLNIQESSSSKSSQTNLDLGIILRRKNSVESVASSASEIVNPLQEESPNVSRRTLPKTQASKTIHEGIRWTQTEISIDPKISDASFSDVALIGNKDCARLVSEQYREVSTSENSMKTCTEGNTDSSQTHSGSKASKKQSINPLPQKRTTAIQRLDKEIQSDVDISMFNNVGSQVNMPKLRNYTIPIQGTNMTLKVSLGNSETSSSDKISSSTDSSKSNQKNIKVESKETLTDKATAVDNSTSLLEECSKGVQSIDNNIFKEPPKPPIFACTQDACKETCYANVNYNINDGKINCGVRCCPNEENKFNTFPKREQINPLKPLLRSNTDTGHMEKTSHVTFEEFVKNEKHKKSGYDLLSTREDESKSVNTETDNEKTTSSCSRSSGKSRGSSNSKKSFDGECQTKSSKASEESPDDNATKDPLIDLIQNITKRYSKKDIEKSKRKKCFKELLTVLNYLLDTEETTDQDQKVSQSSNYETDEVNFECPPTKTFADKAVQLTHKKSKKSNTDSSDLPTSTDMPTTSTDSATCQVLNKIKKECEKYHQRRCKSHSNRVCDASSSTSMNCEQCRRVHHCHCKGYRCHRTKATVDKNKRKCVAYNLILQTDSVASEDTSCDKNPRQLQNIVMKVPKKKTNAPFKEMASKFEKDFHSHIPQCARAHRSRSLPNDSEVSSTDEMSKKAQTLTVREYLERNRPEFVEKSSERQTCLKIVNESRQTETSPRMNMIVVHTPQCSTQCCVEPCHMYCGGVPINYCSGCVNHYDNVHSTKSEVTRFASARAAKRELLSVQVAQQHALKALSESELQELAKELRKDLKTKKLAPKFISERAMKKHSEKIYKSLPEVVRKKEELKKESIRKTNLLLASIFKKNLQKKTLQGAVNLSNYSTIIKL